MIILLKLSSHESMDQDKTYRIFHKQIYSKYDMKQCNNDLQLYMLSLIKSKNGYNMDDVYNVIHWY